MNRSFRQSGIRGSVLILVVLMMTMLLGFVGLAVDFGNLTVVRSQLQMTADAAALAGVNILSTSSGLVVSTAQQYANLNHPNNGTVLRSADVVTGVWDSTNNTFTATSSSPNAVRVTVRRTQANGNPVELLFLPVLGFSNADLTATATAQIVYPTLPYALAGLSSVSMSGTGLIDSYNSNLGAYGGSNVGSSGHIGTNGDISLSGSANIKGDARPGIGKKVTLAGTSKVSGSTSPLTQAISYAAPSAPTTYNNHGLGSSLTLKGNSSLTLTPDTYYFSSMSIANSARLTITGKTTIYLSSSFNMSGAAAIINQTTDPKNLSILLTSTATTVGIGNGTAFYGLIYGPTANVTISGAAKFYGAVVAKKVTVSGSAAIHRDTSVTQSSQAPITQLVK